MQRAHSCLPRGAIYGRVSCSIRREVISGNGRHPCAPTSGRPPNALDRLKPLKQGRQLCVPIVLRVRAPYVSRHSSSLIAVCCCTTATSFASSVDSTISKERHRTTCIELIEGGSLRSEVLVHQLLRLMIRFCTEGIITPTLDEMVLLRSPAIGLGVGLLLICEVER